MRGKPVRLGVALVFAFAVAGMVVGVAARHGAETQEESHKAVAAKQSEAQLVAANYKVLTPTRTRRLLRYADAAYACLSKQFDIGKPRALKTKIVMALPAGVTPAAAAQMGLRCGAKIGDPPKDASLQVRGQAVILYLPKYCILDQKVGR